MRPSSQARDVGIEIGVYRIEIVDVGIEIVNGAKISIKPTIVTIHAKIISRMSRVALLVLASLLSTLSTVCISRVQIVTTAWPS